MAELYFRKGTMADLANAEILNGSINITTDEPAIYLDIDDVRKRIGDVVVVNTLNDLMPKFEGSEDLNWGEANSQYVNAWSTTALYYVTDANALLKWTGEEWKQINSGEGGSSIDLSEIWGQINGLSGRVDNVENSLTSLSPQVNELSEDVADHTTRIEKLEDEVFGDAGLSNVVEQHATQIGELDKKITTNTNNIGALQSSVASIDENKVNKSTYDLLVSNVNSMAETLEGKASQTEVNANKASIETLNAKVQTAEGKIDNHAGRLDTLENTAESLNQAVSTKVEQEVFDELSELVNDNKTVLEEQNQVLANKAEQSVVNKINEQVGSNASAITGLQNSVSTKAEQSTVETLEETLMAKITNDINAANAMEYKGSITSEDDLPQPLVKIGDTYIASENFQTTEKKFGKVISISTGDLIIATIAKDKTESDGYILPDDIIWEHIPTGYSSQFDPYLISNGTSIELKTFNDKDKGSILLTGDNNNVVIENDGANKIKVSLVWGSF